MATMPARILATTLLLALAAPASAQYPDIGPLRQQVELFRQSGQIDDWRWALELSVFDAVWESVVVLLRHVNHHEDRLEAIESMDIPDEDFLEAVLEVTVAAAVVATLDELEPRLADIERRLAALE